ncbi:MAG: RsmG family class I SAM-dependent methyltransferase [Acidimicrobiia bacterium]
MTERAAQPSPDGVLSPADRERLSAVLTVRQGWGILGPGSISDHIEHALRYTAHLPDQRFVGADLGSGAGLPGLVLALARPMSTWRLIDNRAKRGDALNLATRELGLVDRVTVDRRDAQVVGQDEQIRSSCDVVVARSFGKPAVVAECAAGLLKPGGHLIVSEPPRSGDTDVGAGRWPSDALVALGFAGSVELPGGLAILTFIGPVDSGVPRRRLDPPRW